MAVVPLTRIESFSCEIYMIRHGEAESDGDKMRGEIQFALTKKGINQMEEVITQVANLQQKKVSAIFHSNGSSAVLKRSCLLKVLTIIALSVFFL